MDTNLPKSQFIPSDRVMGQLSVHATEAIHHRTRAQNLVLSIMAGMFIAAGAYFSVLLSAGVESQALAFVLMSVGFATGFFFVILSQAVLFTEVNILVPASVLHMQNRQLCSAVMWFWAIAAIGNIIGAVALGFAINITQPIDGLALEQLQHFVAKKMSFHAQGGTGSWLRIILSGILANWLVGMAAYFAMMGQTIIGKYIPVLLAVSLFVVANFQHSPANAGYFSLIMPTGDGPGWYLATVWNLVPAAIGNMIGAIFLVAVPFHFVFGSAVGRASEADAGTCQPL